MQIKDLFKSVIKGVLYSLVIAIILSLILAMIMSRVDFSEPVLNVIYVVISCVSLVIGAIISVKSYGSKGWILGFTVGIIYYIALYLIGIILGGDPHFGMYEFYRLLMSIGVGTLAGMIGINL